MRLFDDPNYKKWRISVYKRDKFKCQWPGCKASKNNLNAHHIRTWANFPNLRYDITNGITLCKFHHKMINGMEDSYISTFLSILKNNAKKL